MMEKKVLPSFNNDFTAVVYEASLSSDNENSVPIYPIIPVDFGFGPTSSDAVCCRATKVSKKAMEKMNLFFNLGLKND